MHYQDFANNLMYLRIYFCTLETRYLWYTERFYILKGLTAKHGSDNCEMTLQ